MENKALVVIDLQNDITKNYREIIDNVNRAIAWANSSGMAVQSCTKSSAGIRIPLYQQLP